MHESFSSVCMSHISYCPIGQSKSWGQVWSHCGRVSQRGLIGRGVPVAIFANIHPTMTIRQSWKASLASY